MKRRLSVLGAVTGLASVLTTPGMGAALSSYTHSVQYDIDVSEASAVTYDRDTDTLFAMGDEGVSIQQLTKTGQVIDSMYFDDSGARAQRTLDDSEGLSYLGNGRIMIADERRNVAWLTTYAAGTTVGKGVMPSYVFGPYDGNTGLEGVAYDPVTDSLWGIKEQGPISIYQLSNFSGTDHVVTNPFPGNRFTRAGISSLSDIYILASSAYFAQDDPRRLNIMVLARDDKKILEMTRTGDVVDTLDISNFGRNTIEGLTMDDQGVIYLVAEETPSLQNRPAMFVLTSQAAPFAITDRHFSWPGDGTIAVDLTWASVAGQSYKVEYSTDMNEWTELDATYTASGTATTTSTLSVPDTGKGYFRVKQISAP